MKSVLLHKRFQKKYAKLSEKIKESFKERRNLFLDDINSPLLSIHLLHGKYSGYKSFNVTGDIRVVFKEIEKGAFLFLDIGTHGDLYY
jgi:mRNA-degrading endonuclease YafQ of YafQ-DinJ toxin-antitoxin module